MKIAFLDLDDIHNPLLGAGQARATYEVGKRLVRLGHRVSVYCSRFPGYTDRVEGGIKYIHIGVNTKNIKVNNLAYIFAAPWRTRSIKADIIIECFTAPVSTLCSPLFTKIPVVGLPTTFDAERFTKLYHLPFHLIEKIGSKLYKYFMPYTKHYEVKMRKYNPDIDCRIIPEGVDNTFFRIIRENPEYILYLGRIGMYQKGLDLLLAAYAKVKDKINYPLTIAGRGTDEQALHKLIVKYGLRERVTFVGPAFAKAKEKLLSHALYVVLPSRNEGFALFSLEALASGLPILCFDIPGFSWTKSHAVIKASPFDTDEYAHLLVHYANVHLIQRLGVYARNLAKKYTWDTVTKQIEEYLQYVLDKEEKIKILLKFSES